MAKPIDAHEVPPDRISWAWRDRVARGTMCDVAGRPDVGKSGLSAMIAAEMTAAGERVLWSNMEDSFGRCRNRLIANGGNPRLAKFWRFRVPVNMEELFAYVREYKISMIIADPVNAHLSNGLKRHSENIREALSPLTEFLEETGCSFLWVDHVNKRVQKNDYPLNAIGGSGSGLVSCCRSAFIFGADPADDDGRYLCTVKCNLREWHKTEALRFEMDSREVDGESTPALLYDDEVNMHAIRMLTTDPEQRGPGRPADKRSQAAEWLTTYLFKAGGPVLASIVRNDAAKAGLSQKTLTNARRDMAIVLNPPGGGQNTTWDLPDEVRAALAEGDDEEIEAAGEAIAEEMTDAETPSAGTDDELPDGGTLSDDDISKLLGGSEATDDE